MNKYIKIACLAWMPIAAAAASAQVTFYEHEGFRGSTFRANRAIVNMQRSGFNDRASSVIVENGRWEVCTDYRFGGDCRVLRPGSYDSLTRMGLGDRVSSVRPAGDGREYRGRQYVDSPDPLPEPNYDYRRRPDERLREVRVTSSRAVFGPEEQRCWVERDQAVRERRDINIPGALIGGVIGGILGHQVGGGRGQDIATGVGAIGGAAVGANVGRNDGRNDDSRGRDVQRCEKTPGSGPLSYWDVTYDFEGVTHRVQMASDPGRTIRVNRRGEPRD